MSKITADKIGSSTGPCRLGRTVELSSYIVTEEGYCLAVRALDEKEVYNQIETTDGVFETIHAGDVLIGALGERKAL
ncbi:MAG TPA: hypothetical protein VFG50_15375, partial [Rhodothermales bacterium]|nr:hypothetical protein [Rhodothermales bacterium]